MIYGLKVFRLKDGTSCILKSPGRKQFDQYAAYQRQVAEETDYLLRTVDEFSCYELQNEKYYIDNVAGAPWGLIITAWISKEMAGEVSLTQVSEYQKQCHRAYLGISVKKKFWALGIGSILMSEIITAAVKMDFEQIELDVIAKNQRAIRLYKKFGFQTFGTNEKAIKQDKGVYQSVHSMALNLDFATCSSGKKGHNR